MGIPATAPKVIRARLAQAAQRLFQAGFLAFAAGGVLAPSLIRVCRLAVAGLPVLLSAGAVALMITGMVFASRRPTRPLSRIALYLWLPLMVFGITLALRLTVVLMFGLHTHQVSDFQLALEAAQQSPPIGALAALVSRRRGWCCTAN